MDIYFGLFLMLCVSWFGATFLYFIHYLRRNTDLEMNTVSLLVMFLGDLKNIPRFYKMFIDAHQRNKYGRNFSVFLVCSNVTSYLAFPLTVIIYAIVMES
jgi:hypothetical protein